MSGAVSARSYFPTVNMHWRRLQRNGCVVRSNGSAIVSEHFLGDSHGRDNISTARLAVDEKGRFLALDLDIIADMGAYLSCYAPYIPWLGVGMATGAYDIPAAHIRLRAAYTNTVPVDAYRGAGRPEASYLIERVVDAAAHDLDMAPDVLRRKNLIKPKALPYTTPTGKVYDSGDFAGTLARAQEVGDWDGFQRSAPRSRAARGGCAASALPPISRLAAITARKPRR